MRRHATLGAAAALTALLWAAVPAPGPGAAGAAAELSGHRAFYTARIGRIREGAGIQDVRGGLAMTLEKTCDAWIVNQQMSIRMISSKGGTVDRETGFAGWESLDGRTYRFITRENATGARQEVKGLATSGVADRPGTARFTEPEPKTVELAPGTLFPVAHTALLIERARAGDRRVDRTVFDGTDGEGPQRVVAFVGTAVPADAAAGTALGPMAARPGWAMQLAFYPLDGAAAVPDYEIAVLQLDNGVARRLTFDYGAFALDMDLERLEALPPPDC